MAGTILDRLEEYTQKDPLAPILFDETYTKGITYHQLDEMSGRVYAWLKQARIGREDFVLINLPRGVLPIIAMIGVWKAGAAWALVEDTYPADRIRFIREDCGCKTELSAANWQDVMCMEPLAGHVQADPHDAAYAVYTSGTTGNPKGVLHEYGNLERAVLSISGGEPMFSEKDCIATLSPLNFVASIIVILATLDVFGAKNYIASYETIKNTAALAKFFITKKISITFLTPSYVRMLGGKKTPFLRMLFVGSEPANNTYVEGLELVNIYACSESGFAVGVFRIDRSYSTCPVGRPVVDTKIMLLDEDGKEAADGETGEMVFEDPYVRGYINLPEQNKKAFIDGYFHTGDLAKKDEAGNYIILGRRDDMIKINGNRIEPAEIEAAFKAALGLQWAAVRGFEEGGKSFLCAYYKDDVSFDANALRGELGRRLPYYMIPAYFIKIDEVPLKASGKLDRKALPRPDAGSFQSDYAAPETETQKKLCEAFEKALGLGQVGIRDDFYELGGDSLAAISLITECDLPGLSSSEIFLGRTPEKIAELYEKKIAESGGKTADEWNAESIKVAHPLTAEQNYMVNYQLYTPFSTMYNLYTMMKLDKELYDMEQACEVMRQVILAHPALLTTYYWNEDGVLLQKYTPEILEELHVEHLTEFELKYVKDTLVYPFKIIGGRLFRCRIFETEKAGYFFFDVHHSIFDGTSFKVFMDSVEKAFTGQPIAQDYYYLMLRDRENAVHTDFYEESRKYFEDRYDGIEWSEYPFIDHRSRSNEMGEIFAELEIEQPQMQEVENAYRISRNEFFITVAALAISIYNNRQDIKVSWNYNGRESMEYMSSIGLLFRELPVGIRFRPERTIRDVFADVQDQVRKGIEHACYPYVDLHGEVATGETAYLLYQQDLRDTESLEDAGIEVIDVRQNQAASQTILDMEILDGSDGLQLMIDFSASWYNEKSMGKFAHIFAGTAQLIAQHDGQEDLTIKEITRRIHKEVIREAIGERISDERQKLGTIGEKITEAPHKLGNTGAGALDGPDRRLDSDEKIISESLHKYRNVGQKASGALHGLRDGAQKASETLHSRNVIKEKVKEGGTLLKSFSTRIRRKR
ncbi:MAG: AMP-binding protein [Eubacteriales bacterium]|nr:AMP-binding protein [Eubacteriales bacterium]